MLRPSRLDCQLKRVPGTATSVTGPLSDTCLMAQQLSRRAIGCLHILIGAEETEEGARPWLPGV